MRFVAFTVRKRFDDETRSRFAKRDATRLFFLFEKAKRRRSDARECAASESRFRGWIGITRGRALWRRARDDGRGAATPLARSRAPEAVPVERHRLGDAARPSAGHARPETRVRGTR